MERAEVELGLGVQPQVAQRRDELFVGTVPRHRHVDPVERPLERRRQRVGDLDHPGRVGRRMPLRLLVVAEAEVEPQLDLGRNDPADADQPLEHARLDVGEPDGKLAVEHPELDVGVPLERQLVGRDRLQDLLQLEHHRRLVRLLNDRLVVEGDEGADRRKRRRKRDLEAAGGRNDAVALEHCERAVRGRGGLCVAERAKAQLCAVVL
jgi:hypothetical protein